MDARLYKDNIIRAVGNPTSGALDALVSMWIDYELSKAALRRLGCEPWTNMLDGIAKVSSKG